MKWLFWIAAAVLLAIVVHTSFILMVPPYTLKRSLAHMAGDLGSNSFFILPLDEQSRLFPTYPKLSVVGVCAYDVSKTNVDLSASLPGGYWTLTIYSSTGDVIYALNDTQSGTSNFTVNLSRAPGLLEMLSQTGQEDAGKLAGWTVKASDPRGFAVLWQPVVEPARRAQVVKAFEKSACKTAA